MNSSTVKAQRGKAEKVYYETPKKGDKERSQVVSPQTPTSFSVIKDADTPSNELHLAGHSISESEHHL